MACIAVIKAHNKTVTKKVDALRKEADKLHEEANKLQDTLIAPCAKCDFDGVYRCEACQADGYIGFNVADYLQ